MRIQIRISDIARTLQPEPRRGMRRERRVAKDDRRPSHHTVHHCARQVSPRHL